jgi:hypothetical protein
VYITGQKNEWLVFLWPHAYACFVRYQRELVGAGFSKIRLTTTRPNDSHSHRPNSAHLFCTTHDGTSYLHDTRWYVASTRSSDKTPTANRTRNGQQVTSGKEHVKEQAANTER